MVLYWDIKKVVRKVGMMAYSVVEKKVEMSVVRKVAVLAER